MFITRRKYESDIRRAELRGQRIEKERHEVDTYIRDLNEDSRRRFENLERLVFNLDNRISNIENCIGLNDKLGLNDK